MAEHVVKGPMSLDLMPILLGDVRVTSIHDLALFDGEVGVIRLIGGSLRVKVISKTEAGKPSRVDFVAVSATDAELHFVNHESIYAVSENDMSFGEFEGRHLKLRYASQRLGRMLTLKIWVGVTGATDGL